MKAGDVGLLDDHKRSEDGDPLHEVVKVVSDEVLANSEDHARHAAIAQKTGNLLRRVARKRSECSLNEPVLGGGQH